jgi:hypothetical protein
MLSRDSSVRPQAPHTKVAKIATDWNNANRETTHQLVARYSAEEGRGWLLPLRPLRPLREVPVEWFRLRVRCLPVLIASGWLAFAPAARAQTRPYIGFVYPAGGQQGTTFQVKLGGQGLEDVNRAFVTGTGVTARLVQYDRALGNQEVTLLNEQLRELKRGKPEAAATMMSSGAPMMASESTMMTSGTSTPKTAAAPAGKDEATLKLLARIEKRTSEWVNRPASVALANIAYVEVTIASDAPPGERELRLGTLRGISNPLVFHVGQLPEICRKPMITASLQVLGKEDLALRRRPATEVEEHITLPCTINGQIASGELNRYRFSARKDQKLVITTQARSLIPYIADAVPGWFQPVLTLYDANGKEVAYDDDYRFKPDPTILYQVPCDGEYALVIFDAIYRGREDFVYRISLGELPFVTSIFPLGGPVGTQSLIHMKGWNLGSDELPPPAAHAEPGTHFLTVRHKELVSNRVPFAIDTLPECLEKEPNDTLKRAQPVDLPIIINGRMDHPNDWDVFKVRGRAGQTIVAEVYARRLDSPLDSVLKLTDAKGHLLAWNDDHEDPGSGVNTHHADSYLLAKLPAAGIYYIHLGDTARNRGEEYTYRLRLSEPQPDFALRVVPSSISLRSKSTAQLSVYALRKDGFTAPIKLALKDPPPGMSANPISISGTQEVARLTLKTTLIETPEPLSLIIAGTAVIAKREVSHDAVPAEDRMQAFLWRHLVPASELKVLVFDPNYQPVPARVPRVRPPAAVEPKPAVASTNAPANKPKFTKQQVAGLLRQLKRLYEEELLTDDFYDQKVTECEAAR